MEYKRQDRFEIRLSLREKERIVKNSSKLGISSSEFLRLCALNKDIQTLVNKDLITSINRIGANINQIL